MRTEHLLPTYLIQRNKPIRVLVVGAGGTGSAFVMGLPYLHQAMLAWGHPGGLEVILVDPDTVSATNCVRQPFAENDIGQKKAIVLMNRINQFWGTHWNAAAIRFRASTLQRNAHWTPDFLIGCVDSKAARLSIHNALIRRGTHSTYWLDLGNGASSGQYVLGQPLNTINRGVRNRLPTVAEKYPEIIDISTGEDTLPSCSAVESLDRQEPFINQTLAMSALAMLARLFRYGRLTHHGAFFNAKSGQMSALPVDTTLWSKSRRCSKKHHSMAM
jgi:PRTRC genetic system ThiF family protein